LPKNDRKRTYTDEEILVRPLSSLDIMSVVSISQSKNLEMPRPMRAARLLEPQASLPAAGHGSIYCSKVIPHGNDP